MQVPLIRLQCGVNSYDWGKVGNDSAAAKFAAATPADGFSIQSEKPYAELWMGTHPSNPSKDVDTGRALLDLVQDNQSLMTSEISEKYNKKLPFLFKVLSINKALSIQAHPNKKLAEKLHEKDSKNYPDDNHKPEMTIAITDFEGLCGFRPLKEIAHFLQTVPALRQLVGDDEAKQFEETIKKDEESSNKKALQSLFKKLMKSSESDLKDGTPKLTSQAEKEGSSFAGNGGDSNTGDELSELVTRLNGQFPNDLGLFVLFFLNYVKMVPGEAMFLQADDIHAYISGDVVECMASSDNVIRAGFTPKFKDVDTLVSCLTYNYAPISEQKMKPQPYPYVKINQKGYSSGSEALLYDPPIEEFSVVRLELGASEAKATFEGIAGPSIVICTQGSGKISVGPKTEELKTGYVYFVGATAELVIESEGEDHLVAFKAFCEIEEHGKQ